MSLNEAQRGIFGAGTYGRPQRGREPLSRLNYDSTAAKLFGTTKHSVQFGDQAQQAEFQKLIGDRDLAAGEYYGDYAIAKSGEQNVLPGYERVGGYMARRALTPVFDEQAYRDKESPNFSEDLQILRRKAEAKPPADEKPPVDPTPKEPAPRLDASGPSLAAALRQQEAERTERPPLQQVLDSALRLNGWKESDEPPAPDSGDQAAAGSSDGRRYAASDRWRKRMEEVSSRFA